MSEVLRHLKLLVVEDNPGDFVLIEEYLSEKFEQPHIDHVKTFDATRQALEENSEYSAILLDLSLPDLSGEALVKRMVQISGRIPIIVLTGYENQEFGLKTLSMGVADYLFKDEISPFVLSKIITYSIERNRAKESLRESEKKYRDIFNLSPQPMYLVDMDSLNIADVNEAAVKQYGYSKQEFLSLHLYDIRPEEEIPALDREIEKANNHPDVFYETNLKHKKKNGEEFYVKISTSNIFQKGKNYRMVLAEDITEKLIAEKAITKKNKLLSASAKISSALINNDDLFKVLGDIFGVIGKAANVDRVSLFEAHPHPESEKPVLSQRLEWAADRIEPQVDNPELQNIEYDNFPGIMSLLLNNKIFKAIIQDMPDGNLKQLLAFQNIESILLLPIFVDEKFWGFIGFDDCSQKRNWDDQEIHYLQTIASNISASIKLRETRDELERREKRFKALVQEGSDLIAILDEEFRFKYVSPSIGSDHESYLGVKAENLIHPDDLKRIEESLQELKRSKRIVLDPYRLQDHTGTYHWVETIITNLRDEPAVQGYVANSRNVSSQIEREKKLKESLKRYDIVSKATSDTIWDLNLETDQMLYNDNIFEMFGYKQKEVEQVGDWWRNKIHPDDLSYIDETLAGVLKNDEERFQMEYRFKASDGTYKHVFDRAFVIKDENGKAIRIIGAMQDVTQDVEEEERLKLFESVITNTAESVVILEADPSDVPGRKILFVNNAFTKLTGYSEEEVLGNTLHFLIGPKTDPLVRKRLRESMANYEEVEVEFINYRKNREEFWVNISMVPVTDNEGNHTHWVAIGRDVTEEKKYQEEIKASLSEKETLLSEIHHRVKNNLAVVSGMMQLQAFETVNKDLQAKLYDSVVRIKTMATVHELLYQSNSFSRLEFSETLKKLVENISNTLQTSNEIELDVSCEPITLNINQAIPASLIVNEVITNAYKHAFRDKESGKISFDLTEKNDHIHIEISDNGIGINEKDMEEKGSLGLHLIQVLSEQIDAKSNYKKQNKGTVFTLDFSRHEIKSGIGNATMS